MNFQITNLGNKIDKLMEKMDKFIDKWIHRLKNDKKDCHFYNI